MRKLVAIAVIGTLAMSSYAQKTVHCSFTTFGKEYQKLLDSQPSKNYSVSITSTYYRDAADKDPMEKSVSVLKVFENNHYIYNGGANVQIQEGDFRLDIDTVKKRMLVSKSNKFEEFLAQYPRFEELDSNRYTITKTESKQRITYELTELKRYSQYHVIKFSFDNVTKQFLELEMLFWPQNYTSTNLEDGSMEAPRMILSYSNFTLGISEKNTSSNDELSSWFKNESGILISLKDNYTLHDLRKK